MTTPLPADTPVADSTSVNNSATRWPSGKLKGGVTGKGWMPGQSGNPAGPPPSLVKQIVSKSGNGSQLVEMLLAVVNGRGRPKPKWSDRIEAARLLLDRGWGKPLQTTELTGPGGGPIQSLNIMANLDIETLHKLVEMRDQVLALQGRQVVEGEIAQHDETPAPSDDNRDALQR